MLKEMFPFAFFLALLFCPQSDAVSQSNSRQPSITYEQHKEAAVRINNLAGNIHSEADASKLVDEIAAIFADELLAKWSLSRTFNRIAHAEFEAMKDSARLIQEQHISDVWNEYVREISAPGDRRVTAAEIHNLRDGLFTGAKLSYARGIQTIWTAPNIYAVGSDGKVSTDGCRAIETLRVIYDLHSHFRNVRAARERLQKGVVASEQVAKRSADSNSRLKGTTRLEARVEEPDSVRSAEYRYEQEHGALIFDQLVQRLFDELFPAF